MLRSCKESMSRKPNLIKALDGHSKYPPMASHRCKFAKPSEWAGICNALIERHMHCAEPLVDVCQNLGIDVQAGAYLVCLVIVQASEQVGQQHYLESSISKQMIPPLVCGDSARLRENQIGQAIYELALQRPSFVRNVLSIYAAAATTDRQIMLCPPDDPNDSHDSVWLQALHFATAFCSFVRLLRVADLTLGLVGYDSSQEGLQRTEMIRRKLGLGDDTPTRIIKPHNTNAGSARRQIGLEVVRHTEHETSVPDGAFYAAMVLGVVIEGWRFAVLDSASKGKLKNQPRLASFQPGTHLSSAMLFTPPFWPPANITEPLSREARMKQREARTALGKAGKPVLRLIPEECQTNLGSLQFFSPGVTEPVTMTLKAISPSSSGLDTVYRIALGTNTISFTTAFSITIGPISNEANHS